MLVCIPTEPIAISQPIIAVPAMVMGAMATVRAIASTRTTSLRAIGFAIISQNILDIPLFIKDERCGHPCRYAAFRGRCRVRNPKQTLANVGMPVGGVLTLGDGRA